MLARMYICAFDRQFSLGLEMFLIDVDRRVNCLYELKVRAITSSPALDHSRGGDRLGGRFIAGELPPGSIHRRFPALSTTSLAPI
jgi:hypothetical protein